MSQKKINWADVTRWFRAAKIHLDRIGLGQTLTNYRTALTFLKAPFKTEDILVDFGVSFEDLRQSLIGTGAAPVPKRKSVIYKPYISHGNGFEVLSPPPEFEDESTWGMMEKKSVKYKERHERLMSRSLRIPGKSGPQGVILIGDAHIGSLGVDYKRLDYIADLVANNPMLWCIQIGDLIDSMIWNSVKYERWKTPLDIPEEIRLGAYWLSRVVPKCLGLVGGNHDIISYKMTGWSHIDTIMQMIGNKIPYNPHQLNLTLFVGEQPYIICMRHKVQGKSQFRTTHGVAKWFRWAPIDADMMIAGHIHISGYQAVELHGKKRHACQLGAYKIVDEYADEHGFLHDTDAPDMLAIFHPDKKNITVMEDLEDGLRLLGSYYDEEIRTGPS